MCDSDRWPIPPYWPEDYWALRELLGDEEFERIGPRIRSHCSTPPRVTGSSDAMPAGLTIASV